MPSASSAIPYADSGGLIAVTTVKTLSIDFADFSFSSVEIAAADVLLVTVSTNAARYRYSAAATATVGYPIVTGETIEIKGKQKIGQLSVVSQTGTANFFITLLTYGIPPA